MNIFFLSADPEECARWHVDKHVVKMLLEYCQILYTVHWLTGNPLPATAYKPTHKHHPSVLWAAANRKHYIWLTCLAQAVHEEYQFRYGPRSHACKPHVDWLAANIPPALPSLPWQPPTPAMPDEFKVADDSIQSYRAFYRGAKSAKGIMSYTGRKFPSWYSSD